MPWQYRVVHTATPYMTGGLKQYEHEYEIVEVYLTEEGEIWGYIEPPAIPYGNNMSDLKGDLWYMIEATRLPVLERSDLSKLEKK